MMDEPRTMRAVVATGGGGPEVLDLVERPVPAPGEGEILVRVAAAGVNRPDVLQRQGLYPPPPGAPDMLGLEIAGAVVALGPGASRFREGDQVLALVPGGGYADYAVVHETNALPVPAGLPAEEAGGLPETYFTVWTNVFERGRLRPGETLLVHGGTSGIGTTAIQLAKAFGASVVATAGSDAKCDACRRLGADVAVNYRDRDFVEAVKAATGGRGADVILDMVGGDYIPRNHEAAADGRAHRPDRLPEGEQGRARLPPADAEAPDPYRLDAARPFRRREGVDRAGAGGEGLAAPRRRTLPAGDGLDLSRSPRFARPTPAWTAASISARSC